METPRCSKIPNLSADWKLNPNVESRITLNKLKIKTPEYETTEFCRTLTNTTKDMGFDFKSEFVLDVLLNDILRKCDDKCELCEEYVQQLRHHITQAHSTSPNAQTVFKCDICNSIYSSPLILIRHRNTHTNNSDTLTNIFPSFDLSSVSTRNESVSPVQYEDHPQQPVRVARKNVEWNCLKLEPSESESEMDISNLNLLGSQQHVNHFSTIENNLKQECDDFECEEDLHDPLLLQDIDVQLQVPSIVKYECTDISTEYELQTVLMTHEKSSNDKPAGSESAVVPSDLITHKITQSKPHKCDICGKCFGRSYHLTQHKLTHAGERPYECDVCGKGFTENCHLTRHKVTHTGEKPFRCDVCGKCFTLNSSLTRHRRTHTGEKPFRCDVCGQSFSRRTHLTRHKLNHVDHSTTPTFVIHLKEGQESEEEVCQGYPFLNL